jgi:hypothetical protein
MEQFSELGQPNHSFSQNKLAIAGVAGEKER